MSTTGAALDDHELEERLRTTLTAVMPLLDGVSDGLPATWAVTDADPPRRPFEPAPTHGARSGRTAVIGAAAVIVLVVAGLVMRPGSDRQPPIADTPPVADGDTSTPSPGDNTIPGKVPPPGSDLMAQIAVAMPAGDWIAAAVQPGEVNPALRLAVFDSSGRKLSFSPVMASDSLGGVEPTLPPVTAGSSGRIAYPYPDGTLVLVDPDGTGVHVSCTEWTAPCRSFVIPAGDLASAADGLFELVRSDLSAVARDDADTALDPVAVFQLANDALGTGVTAPLLDTGVVSQAGSGTYVANDDGEIAVSQVRDDGLLVRWRLTAPIATSGIAVEEITAALDAAVMQAPPAARAPSTTILETTTAPAIEPLRFLPVEMPEGFPAEVASYRTDIEGNEPVPTETKLYAGSGDSPPVVMVFIDPIDFDIADGFQDFTTDATWPSFRIDLTRFDGRHVFVATGGLTADQARAVADAIAVTDVDKSPTVDLPFDLAEVPFEYQPELAYAVDWTNGAGADVTMLVESDHGVDALANGITWPINAVTTANGTVYVSRDLSDPQYLQAGIVIDGHAVNFEARNVDSDELIRMASSVTRVSEQE